MTIIRNKSFAKDEVLIAILDANKDYFEDSREFGKAKSYLESFFDIIGNDRSYKSQILDQLRKE